MNELISTNVRFYRHSGKAPIMGLLLIGIAGFIAIPILGAIYALLIHFIPFIYLDALIVIGYAVAVSVVLSSAARYGKVRNMFLLGLAAFFFGVLADYIGWVVWLTLVVGDPKFLVEFIFPLDVLYYITLIAQEGAWSIGGTTPTGTVLYLFWFIEACIVIGGTIYLTVKSFSKTPFCEDSDRWADKRSVLGLFNPLSNIPQFKNAVLQGSFAPFNELKPSNPNSNHYTLLEVYECVECKNFFVLNVDDVTIKINNKGKADATTKSIIENLIVTPTTLSSLRKLSEPKVEALAF